MPFKNIIGAVIQLSLHHLNAWDRPKGISPSEAKPIQFSYLKRICSIFRCLCGGEEQIGERRYKEEQKKRNEKRWEFEKRRVEGRAKMEEGGKGGSKRTNKGVTSTISLFDLKG